MNIQLLRATLVWLGLLVVAVLAAGIRQTLLEPSLGEPAAHRLGTLLAVALFAVVIWLTVGWVCPSLEPRSLWIVGGLWLVSTVAFEFGFGHWVAGHSWSRLCADYDLLAGRLWVLVLLTVAAGPRVLGGLRARSKRVG